MPVQLQTDKLWFNHTITEKQYIYVPDIQLQSPSVITSYTNGYTTLHHIYYSYKTVAAV